MYDFESELLISDRVLEEVKMPKCLETDAMGAFQLKVKQIGEGLHLVYLSIIKRDEKTKKKTKNFWKK